MYLRPDEVARVLEKAGFTVDVVTNKTYGYRRGENYVYVNREARMGRTALIIHPRLKDRSSSLADPASDIKTCDHYQNFPLYLGGETHEHYLGGETHEHYGIPHGFSSRIALERYLNGLFGDEKSD
ncbi:YgaC family protein [Salmonella enterica subsp. enterica serovar Typhimurium]|nr:YgaC family protein [Salmonella enterica subsp. enterica serovar Stanley]EHL4005554.1 YgaC family protein [Salmonella enterica subsp. enterica serovar Stanley]EHL4010807.1 YgaC family protein [Salmonella enterica subsp. enterica serovar Stanley]MBJ3315346.1 YgaC family protein [Salmonella enterica subsp. enterica serovar Typhimurium]